MSRRAQLLCLSLLLNLILLLIAIRPFFDQKISSRSERAHYSYLSPRIFIDDPNDLIINFIPLRNQLGSYVEKLPYRTGVYFEYLPTGNSIGIHEKQEFIPASLLKTPLAMAIYKDIEAKKMHEDDIITLEPADLDNNFGTLWKKGAGTKLTVHEVVDILLKESDNTAQHALFRQLNGPEIDDVFDSLDIPKERNEKFHNKSVVTAKNYSSVLRCLYLSCYLSKNNSNEILDHLANSLYTDKLPYPIPKSVNVAHKIGVSIGDDPTKNIYTDCGIVYVPKRPYILCLMTESDEQNATQTMRYVSKIVYSYISSVNK